jgi:Tfp pilus assembly protein PilV
VSRAKRRLERAKRRTRGIALIEVMVAIVMLGVAVSGLAGMSFWVATRAKVTNLRNARYAAEVKLVDQLTVTPFDSLPARVGCRAVTDPVFPHTWCMSLTDLTPRHRVVTLILQPDNSSIRPDTVEFERTKATPYNPLS